MNNELELDRNKSWLGWLRQALYFSTSWNDCMPSVSRRPTWPLGTMASILAVSLSQPSRLSHTHQSQWQASRTHTPTIMTKDATCIQMRVEVRAWQILQGAAGPRGEIQPQSPLYHYSKIGWRWRHEKYDSVCVRWWGRRKESAAYDDLCMHGVCASEDIVSVMWN